MIWIASGLIVAVLAWLWYLIRTAPHGYQDEDGFHYDDEPPVK